MLERRPIAAGFFLALLTYKPQFGISDSDRSAGLAQLARSCERGGLQPRPCRSGRTRIGAGAWSSFRSSLTNGGSNLSPDAADQLTHFGVWHLAVGRGWHTDRIHGTGRPRAVLAAAVWAVWSKPIAHSIRASLLCVASFLASPYVLYYDLCLLTIAFAFFVGDGLRRGFLAGERTVLLVCWIALNFSARSAPLIACAVLLSLLYRRISALRQDELRA